MTDKHFFGFFSNMSESALFPFIDVDADQDFKSSHDIYEVYLNGHHVGNKMLLTQNEDVSVIDDFLHERGYHDYDSRVEGDQYIITTDHTDKLHEMHENLRVYLHMR
ncbi:hypothetical protein [Caldalkalibacillus salinus]|uniref:hypothetical protein n=1 Tax=Caldalkalibacillus salinus TaxID=2803787 RepID=UPI001922EF7D|nr:hypothetical protein [Caldalkalibacillus salinus]